MRHAYRYGFLTALLASFAITADSCSDESPPRPTAVDQQRYDAQTMVANEQTYSYEVENIKKRRVLFGKPGVIGYVVFLNQAGQPINYITINGKCTSSGKRITPTDRLDDHGVGNNTVVRQALGEDGVYGASEDYIYCFGTDGRYWQWSGSYLYSDKPFDLTIKPLVVDTRAHTSAQ